MKHQEVTLAPGLYFVATPIGNARDITLRALDILASADVLVAEDTRTLRKLMDIHGLPLRGRRIVAFHDHSKTGVAAGLIAQIGAGQSVAYASEAGTPLVADPGYELGVAVADAGHVVTSAPGASAALAALTVAGLAPDRFAFVGFLPATAARRQAEIAALRAEPFTLIFYESPKRVKEMLGDLRDILGGNRAAAVARELTKRFEEIQRGTLDDLCQWADDRTIKGEVVVLVARTDEEGADLADVEGDLRRALADMRVKDAATMVAGAHNLPRKEVYQMALRLQQDGTSE